MSGSPSKGSIRSGIGHAECQAIAALAAGNHGDPFALLGMHQAPDRRSMVVRAFIPGAQLVEVVEEPGRGSPIALELVHRDGFFRGRVPGHRKPFRYRLRVTTASDVQEMDDPYRFPPILREADLLSFVRGESVRAADLLGARRCAIDGIEGTLFAVWAPNAQRVSVVGEFNGWDGRRHAMRRRPEAGVWEIFIPEVGEGALYKYEVRTQSGELLPLKADPYGFAGEHPPATASQVAVTPAWQRGTTSPSQRARLNAYDAPIAIYEAHLGSWRRGPSGQYLSYAELADQLVPYVADMGFTHIELLPIAEHPFDGSWGYQPLGLFAPTTRFGAPEEFRDLVGRCHEAGLGVVLDWVPGHFPSDLHGLTRFDGTHLYEHADPRQGRHPDWDTLIYNFSRREVAAFLISNALHWIEKFDVDGLRVDAVASMLYLDYSRGPGEWIPNTYGGRENLDAIAFLRRLNDVITSQHPGVVTIAEESTAWPMVSRPTSIGGLGFGYKWNMGWMHDTLNYMSKDPVHRKYHHDELTFGLFYAHHENFILPLSHDEVVHGKGSLLGRMPGDRWQRFANLRAYYAFMYTQPGKKLLFMGGEFAQADEWNHDRGLDWHLLDASEHRGAQTLVRDLNGLYKTRPALHEGDCNSHGFAWIDCSDCEQSVVSYIRRGRDPAIFAVVVCNFTPVVRYAYRIGVPRPGYYRELLNTDATIYGGSNVGNLGGVEAEALAQHGHPWSLSLTLPPLGVLVFEPVSG